MFVLMLFKEHILDWNAWTSGQKSKVRPKPGFANYSRLTLLLAALGFGTVSLCKRWNVDWALW